MTPIYVDPAEAALKEFRKKVSDASRTLAETGRDFHDRGWSLATSSNFSKLISRDPFRLLITASGRDKGRLHDHDFVIVDETGLPIELNMPRPSAETQLHLAIVLETGAESVLHTHSIWGTILSDIHFPTGQMQISGFEMLKAFDGIKTQEATLTIPVFENTQNIGELAEELRARFTAAPPMRHAFLIRGHGLYTWGTDVPAARRHVEALEFLFEVTGRMMTLTPPITPT